MVEYLENLILDNWDRWSNSTKPINLDFLKTHAGQATRNKKVGFFVFNQDKPLIFVKTIRENIYNSVIEDGFERLKSINNHLKDGSVPRPIYCGYYQNTAFSLEDAIGGKQFHSFKKPEDLERFLKWFFKFQQLMKQNKERKGDQLIDYLKDLVHKFTSLYDPEEDLKALIQKNVGDLEKEIGSLSLSLVSQHGDLTPDNVLIDNNQIKVIDWDNFEKINLPLFDLLVFLQRWSAIRDISFVREYDNIIKKYLDEFSIDKKALKLLVFCYYLLDFLRKKEILTGYDKEYFTERLKEIKNSNL